MISVKSILFRNLTDADFYNINKSPGSEEKGGGQSYIDFPISSISADEWAFFLENINNLTSGRGASNRPFWQVPIHSLGIAPSSNQQIVKIFQRRAASYSIASQKLFSSQSNRILSWHPNNNFPVPIDNTNRQQCPMGLIIYLASTYDGNVWAGWFLNDGTSPLPIADELSRRLLGPLLNNVNTRNGESGSIRFPINTLFLRNSTQPFYSSPEVQPLNPPVPNIVTQEEEEIEADTLFNDDISTSNSSGPATVTQRTVNIRTRNKKVVSDLKNLYRHTCQITGDRYIFKKKNGEGYTEAHHLVPLGNDGDDSARNLVILCPMMHRMLHYADVSEINLDNIITNEDGIATLEININGQSYTIKWHPNHARLVTGN